MKHHKHIAVIAVLSLAVLILGANQLYQAGRWAGTHRSMRFV